MFVPEIKLLLERVREDLVREWELVWELVREWELIRKWEVDMSSYPLFFKFLLK